jgi:hypothetical protein
MANVAGNSIGMFILLMIMVASAVNESVFSIRSSTSDSFNLFGYENVFAAGKEK